MRVQVYPEYYNGQLQGEGVEIYGQLSSDGKSRMFLSENGKVKIAYDKIHSDGNNKCGDPDQNIDVFVMETTAIGLVCCMDVNNPPLLMSVRNKLDASGATSKMICISAHMSSDWFKGDTLSPDLHGYLVVMANGNPDGVDSFIAGVDGTKLDGLSMNIGNLSVINNGCT